jgi:hypothetical protein
MWNIRFRTEAKAFGAGSGSCKMMRLLKAPAPQSLLNHTVQYDLKNKIKSEDQQTVQYQHLNSGKLKIILMQKLFYCIFLPNLIKIQFFLKTSYRKGRASKRNLNCKD